MSIADNSGCLAAVVVWCSYRALRVQRLYAAAVCVARGGGDSRRQVS